MRAAGSAAALLLIAAVAFVDYQTGRRVTLGSYYLLPIAVAAWFGGAAAAAGSAALATAAAFTVNQLLPPVEFDYPSAVYWDDVARLVLFGLAGVSLARLRELRDHLSRTVDERTEALLHANEELRAVGYAAVHNLRAPLRVIARRAADDPEVRRAIERSQQLIEGLLTLTRVASQELRREPVDLSALAREEAAALPGVATDVAPGLRAHCDPVMARALLRALLHNAWKFTRGRPDGRVSVGQGPSGVFHVADNGEGFDMAYSSRLFEPFQSVHGPPLAGTGIGLPLAVRVVRRHGGWIAAEGAPGSGARVSFTLAPERRVSRALRPWWPLRRREARLARR